MTFINVKRFFASAFILLLGLALNITTAIPTNAAPDYTSTYLPEIISFKTTVATVIRTEKAFGKDFTFESKEFIFDLTVKVHRNTLSGISIIMRGPAKPESTLVAPCETFEGSISSGALRYGSDYQSADSWTQLNGLQSREQAGDFYIEKYQFKGGMDFTFADDRSEGMGFCEGTYALSQIDLWDMAKRKISINLPGSSTAQVYCNSAAITCESGVVITDFWKKNNLTTNSCIEVGSLGYFNDVAYRNCFKGEWKSLDFTISKSNTPTLGKLEVFDYKSLYDLSLKDKAELAALNKSLTTDKTALQGQVASLTADKTALQGQVTSLTADKSSLQAQLNSFEAQFKLLSESASSTQSQISQLNSKLTVAVSGQSAAIAKLKKVCSVKPKPKGC